jgi:hypothetical protein
VYLCSTILGYTFPGPRQVYEQNVGDGQGLCLQQFRVQETYCPRCVVWLSRCKSLILACHQANRFIENACGCVDKVLMDESKRCRGALRSNPVSSLTEQDRSDLGRVYRVDWSRSPSSTKFKTDSRLSKRYGRALWNS